MVFWNRLRQSQLRNLLRNQFQKSYLQTYTSNQASLHTRIGIVNIPRFASLLQSNLQINLPNNVRFYAAPVQVKKKVEVETKGPKLNEKITAPVIRLVSNEGHEVLTRREALERAKGLDVDLVEVDRNANPPVCKLMDYNKERYKQQVKDKERAKSSKANLKKGTVKEIRFTGQITPNDIQMKADSTRRLLEEGYRVKCLVKRKKKDDDLGKCLSQLLSRIEDISMVDFGPIVEEDQAHVVLRHVKLGSPKKSSKKASKAVSPSSADSTQYENGSESDEDDRVFDAEDGASMNVRSNKEELTTLPVNRYSQSTSGRPSTDSAGRPVAPFGTENRYKREPRNNNAPASNNSTRIEAPPTERGRQPQFNPTSTHIHEGQHFGFGNPNFPRQNSAGSSYGNFGAPHSASPEQQSPPGQVNRYKKVSVGDGNRSLTSHGTLDNRYSAGASSRYSRGAVINKDGQGKFGAFSSNGQT